MLKDRILKNIFFIVFLMAGFASEAQVNLNEYKYVVVPKKLSSFKKENQHQTSTLVKHLFSKKGFLTTYEDAMPPDLIKNRCLGLYVDLVNNSSMFTTKTALSLKDCNNQEVFLTEEGRSKQKEFKGAFSEAIKEAFNSFATIDYSYEPKEEVKTQEIVTASFKNDVKSLEETSAENQETVKKQIATQEEQYFKDQTPNESNFKKTEALEGEKMTVQKATNEEQSFKDTTPVQSDYSKEQSASKIIGDVLYAQELTNGYQLVDSTPKIRLKIYKSSMPNVYIAEANEKSGVVYSSDGKWFFEHQEEGRVVKEELNIKF